MPAAAKAAPAAGAPAAPQIFTGADSDDDDIEVVEASSPLGGTFGGFGLGAADRAAAAGAGGKLARDLAGEEVDLDERDDAAVDEGVRLGPRRGGGRKPEAAGDLAAVQEVVQRLNKAAQPLGRAMDYLQEDIDGMVKEASFW